MSVTWQYRLVGKFTATLRMRVKPVITTSCCTLTPAYWRTWNVILHADKHDFNFIKSLCKNIH